MGVARAIAPRTPRSVILRSVWPSEWARVQGRCCFTKFFPFILRPGRHQQGGLGFLVKAGLLQEDAANEWIWYLELNIRAATHRAVEPRGQLCEELVRLQRLECKELVHGAADFHDRFLIKLCPDYL